MATWFKATPTLRWVDKLVPAEWDSTGRTKERRRVLQQWWVLMDSNRFVAFDYAEGEWRDVPTETDE